MSAVSYGLTCMELEAGDSGVRSLVSVQGSLAMFAIWRWGSEEQKQRWLPPMHAGEAIGCFGLTEPDAGSDPGAMRTQRAARRLRLAPQRDEDVDHQRVDRRRRGGLGTHRCGRHQRLPRRARHGRLHRAGDEAQALAPRIGDVGARAPRRARAGGEPLPEIDSLRGPLSCLNEARYGIVWGSVGAARACFEAALEYSKERIVFGSRSPATS